MHRIRNIHSPHGSGIGLEQAFLYAIFVLMKL